MSVLSHSDIENAIEIGDIKITPFDKNSISCASYDLTLSNEFRYYLPPQNILEVTENTNYLDITEKIIVEEGGHYLLLPNTACIGITKETITLSPKYCALLEGRSRFARLGLFIHITASFINPGVSNKQVLEIFNASNYTLALKPGTKLCQLIFLKMESEATYNGKFQGTSNEL